MKKKFQPKSEYGYNRNLVHHDEKNICKYSGLYCRFSRTCLLVKTECCEKIVRLYNQEDEVNLRKFCKRCKRENGGKCLFVCAIKKELEGDQNEKKKGIK